MSAPTLPAKGERTAEQTSFYAIFQQFAPRLYRQAVRVFGNNDEASEAVQEVFVQIYRSLPKFRGEAELATWIYRIAANHFVTRKRRKRHDTVPLEDSRIVETLCEDGADPQSELERKEVREQLARLIARLPPRESVAITLFYMDGCDYKEIASLLDTTVGAVGLVLHRGREHLHMLLTGKKGGDR